ncbi:hypothetical protein J3T72_06305 [Staphylococcus simiae]|nr:hypothetical protein [Staphylococcus simiae]MBO1201270.1 hypothetical protein [Staphylococcus simiae]MBO1210915.1 hypothetical protein [Staphylococcus simiae]MBO1229577.1 hypothetical protein [Staphylococcus simiae]
MLEPYFDAAFTIFLMILVYILLIGPENSGPLYLTLDDITIFFNDK